MANICSIHHPAMGPVKGCRLCHTHPRDAFPDWDKKKAEAEAAGEQRCLDCDFISYRTALGCPKCGRVKPGRMEILSGPPEDG